jgi:hypothetical protein
MRSAVSGVLPRRSRVPPLDRRFNAAEPTYCQLVSSAARALSTREDERGLVSDVPSPPEPNRAREALIRVPSIEIVCHHRTVKNGGFPIRDAFHRSGALSGPPLVLRRTERGVQLPTSLHPLRVTASG